ncbi:ferredoxin [Amycolatopsis sp. YIM 10]|uniref:ferredoxin n=1 Tax=Amycolatopsis sp. YIM 10 TaxID=2653857 RepID=UPI0012AA3ABC|nr:Ferredoxin-2 [Amycolatopsis sp. YIM 10]
MTGTSLRVSVDRDRCVGTGGCVFAAEEVFDQNDEDGRVVLRTEYPGPDLAEAVRQAVDVCPVYAIALAEKENGR